MIAASLVENLLGDEGDDLDPKSMIRGMEKRHPGYTLTNFEDLDHFAKAYLEAAFFTDEERLKEEAEESGLDPDEHDFEWSLEAVQSAKDDCDKFQQQAQALLDQAGDVEQNGHDFWYTRNGHGVGFWDRGYPEEVSDALDEICKRFGEKTTYLGNDGQIYFF